MVPNTVFFLFMVACFGYGSSLEDNHPSTTDYSWMIGVGEELVKQKLNRDSFPIEWLGLLATSRREHDWRRKMILDKMNEESWEAWIVLDIIFNAWDQYRKELALANTNEDEQTTTEVNPELDRSTLVNEQSEVDEADGTQAATEMRTFYNDITPYLSRRLLKTFVPTKADTVSPSSVPEDSATTTSSEKYSFITNLKIDQGTPGIDYPDYVDIPATSFSCLDKTSIPGFYADLETGCQVFHACRSDRRESFLCPVGTTFNQTLMKCDYWYNTNCSLAPLFFDLNIPFLKETSMKIDDLSTSQYSATSEATKQFESSNGSPSAETKPLEESFDEIELSTEDWNRITDFLPIKAKVTVYSKNIEHEELSSDMPLPLRSALKSKRELTVDEKGRKVQTASRIVDGAIDLAERVAKDTARFVMEIIKGRANSEEKARKADVAAKIVDEATELAARVAKDTAQLINRIILEAVNQAGKSGHVTPAGTGPKVSPHEVKHRSFTTPKTAQRKSPEINPRFVVKPAAAPEVLKQNKRLDTNSKNDAKEHILEIIDRAFEMVLNVDIFPATRQAILENYVKVALSKKH